MIRILTGDALEQLRTLPDASVQCCVTSPPYYGLRDYGVDGQIGLEETPDAFVARLVNVFREVRRVLRDDGTLWLNIGDSYAVNGWKQTGRGDQGGACSSSRLGPKKNGLPNNAKITGQKIRLETGHKPKDLIGIPWLLAFALRADGWYLRQDIIWHKPNPMPESVTDRCTKSHEYVFLLSKSSRYYYDADAIKEQAIHEGRVVKASGDDAKNGQKGEFGRTASGFTTHDTVVTDRNKRSVWSITTQPYSEAHFATMAPALAETCIKAGTKPGDTVLDPFGGAGTTALCADRLGRDATLIELNPAYVEIARNRLTKDAGMFAEVAA